MAALATAKFEVLIRVFKLYVSFLPYTDGFTSLHHAYDNDDDEGLTIF